MGDVQVKCGGRWLELAGSVEDLEYTSAWRFDDYCGDTTAQWKFEWPWDNTPAFLSRGARVQMYDGGARIWGGILSEPDRGAPWSMAAKGLGEELKRYPALEEVEYDDDTLTVPSHTPDKAFDYAVETLGMSLWRSTSLGAEPLGEDNDTPEAEQEILFMRALLMRRAAQLGKRLHVGVDGHVSFVDDPATVIWMVHPGIAYMGTSDPDYVTDMWALYIYDANVTIGPPAAVTTVAAYDMVRASDADAALRWGAAHHVLDLTKLGWLGFNKANPAFSSPSIARSEARQFAEGRLKLVGARLAFTTEIELDDQVLQFVTGAQGNPSDVRCGHMLRLYGALDSAGDIRSGATADITAGEVTYRAATRTARVRPMGFTPRDFAGNVRNPEPEEKERVDTP